MGQRSQIYVVKENEDYSLNLIVARYFQWNYGERMVSRAKTLIADYLPYIMQYEYMVKELKINPEMGTNSENKKLIQMIETNFDMRDITLSYDLVTETIEDVKKGYYGYDRINDILFEPDNNDGQLFIKIDKDNQIHYCFYDYFNKAVMDANEYMNWDCGYMHSSNPNKWQMYYRDDNEIIDYTKENIMAINVSGARLMTKPEVERIKNYNYEEFRSLKPKSLEEKISEKQEKVEQQEIKSDKNITHEK